MDVGRHYILKVYLIRYLLDLRLNQNSDDSTSLKTSTRNFPQNTRLVDMCWILIVTRPLKSSPIGREPVDPKKGRILKGQCQKESVKLLLTHIVNSRHSSREDIFTKLQDAVNP